MRTKNNLKKHLIFNKKRLILYTIVLTILLLSVGYSAFSSNLSISGLAAQVRLEKNIRITGISMISGEFDGKSTYVNYNINSIEANIELPNQESSVTFSVAITNIASAEAGVLEITGLPDNLDYELLNYNLEEKICNDENKCNLGIKKDIQVKIKYKTGGYKNDNLKYNILANFNFKQVYDVKYIDVENNGYPEEVMDTTTLTINFKEDIPKYLLVKIDDKEITNYTYENGILTILDVFGNVEIIKNEKKEILETLKNEATTYAINNSLQKESIQISNFNSSIDEATLEKHDLYNKYLTIVPNDSTYDVYLGNKLYVNNNNQTVENLIDVLSYKIYGNTIQQGEPSPSSPAEIKSVGDKSVNLFDGEWTTGRWVTSTGVSSSDKNSIKFKNPITLEPNTTYYVSVQDSRDYYPALFSEDGSEFKNLGLKLNDFIFTTTDTLYVFSMFQYKDTTIPINIQVEKGNRATEYSDYGKYEILVNVEGKNLFNKNNYNMYKGTLSTTAITNNSSSATIYIKCEPNTTYTVSKALESSDFKVGFGNEIANKATISNFASNSSGTIITSNSGENTYMFVEVYYSETDTYSFEEIIDKLQIQKGTEATEYEEYVEPTRIYLDEPLRKMGTGIDYIDFVNSRVGRNTKQVVLNGSEEWNATSDYEHGILKTILGLNEEEGSTNLLSSHFKVVSTQADENGLFSVGNESLNFYYNETMDFKTWLTNNNVDILFPLDQQTDESAILPRINTTGVTASINVVTEVLPSSIEFVVIQKIQQL